jgi:peptidoglycan-associated lipoprotein
MKLKTLFFAAIIVAALTACSETDEKDALASGTGPGGLNTDASTSGLNGGAGVNGSEFGAGGMGGANGGRSGFGGNGAGGNGKYPNAAIGPEFSDPNNPLSRSIIYFTLDSSEIQPDFIPIVNAHAQYLAAHPSQRVTLEGHADERGSREYNIGLGEQRGKMVSSKLTLQGVGDSQLDVVSYGEEKPAAFGSDESAWEQNRRVELVYQGR